MAEASKLEEAFVALEALAGPGGQRADLMKPTNVRHLCTMERMDVARFTRLMIRIAGWTPHVTELKKLMSKAKAASAELKAKEHAEEELRERLERAREAGRPFIASGMPVKIAADFLAQRFPHLVYLGEEWLNYQGNCYAKIDGLAVRQAVQRFCVAGVDEATGEDYVTKKKEVDDIMDGVRNMVYRDKASYNPPTWLETDSTEPPADLTLSCGNGLLDLTTRTLMPPSWTFFTRNGLEYDYIPREDCPPPREWLETLEKWWPGDSETQEALQEMFGYIISGDTSYQKLFMIVGPGRSGKGTINDVLTNLVGKANAVSKQLRDLKGEFGLADMVGKTLFTISDMRMDKNTSTAHLAELLLNIVGEDFIGINAKFKDAYTTKLNTRVVLYGNMELALPDKAGALAMRCIPFLMTKSFFNNEDLTLSDRIVANELPGVLNWALDGLDRLRARGCFKLTKGGEKVLKAIKLKASPVMSFLAEVCEDGEAVPVRVLHKAFEGWFKEKGFSPWQDEEHFVEEVHMVNRLADVERREYGGKRVRCFTHIALKPEFVDHKWESDDLADDDTGEE
jgi:putative DNA primase/helicase